MDLPAVDQIFDRSDVSPVVADRNGSERWQEDGRERVDGKHRDRVRIVRDDTSETIPELCQGVFCGRVGAGCIGRYCSNWTVSTRTLTVSRFSSVQLRSIMIAGFEVYGDTAMTDGHLLTMYGTRRTGVASRDEIGVLRGILRTREFPLVVPMAVRHDHPDR